MLDWGTVGEGSGSEIDPVDHPTLVLVHGTSFVEFSNFHLL